MTQTIEHAADMERRRWRFAANHPDLPESQRRFAVQMAKQMEEYSDEDVVRHVKFRKDASKEYRNDPDKKAGTVSYYEVSKPGVDGIFCPNEFNALAQDMRKSSSRYKKGGRKKGSGSLRSKLVTREWRELYVAKYVELLQRGYTQEGAGEFLYYKAKLVDGFEFGPVKPSKQKAVRLYRMIESLDEFKAIS